MALVASAAAGALWASLSVRALREAVAAVLLPDAGNSYQQEDFEQPIASPSLSPLSSPPVLPVMHLLPEDALLHAMRYLDAIALCATRASAKQLLLTERAHSPALWRPLCEHDFRSSSKFCPAAAARRVTMTPQPERSFLHQHQLPLAMGHDGLQQQSRVQEINYHVEYLRHVHRYAVEELTHAEATAGVRLPLSAYLDAVRGDSASGGSGGGSFGMGASAAVGWIRGGGGNGGSSGQPRQEPVVGIVGDLGWIEDEDVARAVSIRRRLALKTAVVVSHTVVGDFRRRTGHHAPFSFLPMDAIPDFLRLPRNCDQAAAVAATGAAEALAERLVRLERRPPLQADGFLGYAVDFFVLPPGREYLRETALHTLFRDLSVWRTAADAERWRVASGAAHIYCCSLDHPDETFSSTAEGAAAAEAASAVYISHWGPRVPVSGPDKRPQLATLARNTQHALAYVVYGSGL
ncbi:unnamed protein product [Phaeothamnion confervicola]